MKNQEEMAKKAKEFNNAIDSIELRSIPLGYNYNIGALIYSESVKREIMDYCRSFEAYMEDQRSKQ